MRSRFVIRLARTLRLFALVAAVPFSNFVDADESPSANSARTDVEREGLEFVRKHPSEWEYKVTMDVMTDKPVAEVNSTQSNDTGVSGSLHGKCEDDGTITFIVVVSADKGQTPDIIGSQDGSARVRYRLNDSLLKLFLASMDYNNRFKALVVAGPDVGALKMLGLMLSEKAKGVRLANWDQVWGALISFETSQGDLVVSIPARHSEIQKLFAFCFGGR
jgi:hypothetical protein